MASNSDDVFERFLRDLCEILGMDDFTLVETQELLLDGMAVGFACEGDEDGLDLLWFARLGTPAPERQASVYRVLLEANHFWVGTGGATLGIQPDTGAVMLYGRLALQPLSADAFVPVLDAFHQNAVFWQGYIAGEHDDAAASAASLVNHA